MSRNKFNTRSAPFKTGNKNLLRHTENQKTRKFAAWLVQEFEKQLAKADRAEKQKASYQSAASKNSKTMNDHDAFFAQYGIGTERQEQVIDVNPEHPYAITWEHEQ